MIRVENLVKRFGEVVAVDDLSFEVDRGEVLGFLGPNGAGKTTTMRILTGFLPPTSGRVSVAGHDVLDEPLEVKRRVGYLPESVPVYPEMGVVEYLKFVCELKGIPGSQRAAAIERSMERTDIADRRSRIIGHLSKGYRKRVGLAQALLGDPDVLVLDEPTEGLDPNQVVAIRELVTSLSGERTVIVSTHILTEVEQTCSRVLIIDRGRLVVTDSVAAIQASLRTEGTQIRLQVRGDAGAVARILDGLPAVTRVERVGGSDDAGIFRIGLGRAEGAEEVARTIVDGGFGLMEMARERVSLEEVFVRLTRGVPS